jgi:ABC-type lipoprotein release transport system permease subunit
MKFRWFQTILSIIAIALPVLLICLTDILITSYDQTTDFIFDKKDKGLKQQIKDLNEEYRKITLGMGFNILILPKEQNLSDFYADDFAMSDMPEEYCELLSNSKMITINHLMPSLFQKTVWAEKKRTILLTGIRGEVPLLHRTNSKKSLQEAVMPGHIVLGYELWRDLGYNAGDTLQLNKNKFVVSKCNEERGTTDDVTVWIDLIEAQKMLSKQGKISAMFALECRCEGTQNFVNIAQIRKDVETILPQTQVIEFMSEALSRAEARWRVITLAKEKNESDKQYRENFIKVKKKTTYKLLSMFFAGSLLLIFWVTNKNIHERRAEIALYRSLGIKTAKIWGVFWGRTVSTGFIGCLIGLIAGIISAHFLTLVWFDSLKELSLNVHIIYGTVIIYVSSVIVVHIPILNIVSKDTAIILSKL